MSMGRIKCKLCLKKKQAKKSIFAPKIALRVGRSDPARNSFFPPTFLVPASGVVSFPAAVLRLQQARRLQRSWRVQEVVGPVYRICRGI